MDPIERHIKQHFDNKDYTYNEAHWKEAQKLIAENKRRRRGWLYWWTGGVAVLLLAVLAFWSISTETRIVSSGLVNNIEYLSPAELTTSQAVTKQESEKTSIGKSDNSFYESTNIAEASIPTVQKGESISSITSQRNKAGNSKQDSKTSKNNTQNSNAKSGRANNSGNVDLLEINNSKISTHQKSSEKLFAENKEEGYLIAKDESDTEESKNQYQVQREESVIIDSDLVVIDDSSSESELPVTVLNEQLTVENTEEIADILSINPVKKNARFGWGFVAGYLIQKRFTEDQWLNGAYFGVRASWRLTPKWSIGSDLSLVMQEMESVHFHHNVIEGYGFGRDSMVTDLYAKRAITLQIPLAISYAIGRHTLTGMIGSRILLDGQARMEKLHYTNADPNNTTSAVIVSRSTMVTKKEQLMPDGALAPFSIYSGLRYGWMMGKGWGLETNVSIPLYHKNARLDYGTMMAADRGIRLEIGVMKVF